MTHIPVLLREVIKFLEPRPGEFFIDGTIDGGGHGAEIFEKVGPDGMLLGIDWDERMIEMAKGKISAKSNLKSPRLRRARLPDGQGFGGQEKSKLILIHGNYADLPEILKNEKLPKADGLPLDLGFSSEQLETSGRGFSFTKNEPLLMTYDSSREPV
ncbi:MAG: 16S rRNA (cytosine(1402)-N(4))-methyltransferase, partial [Parcubacteria group bacterium]|nr:16S rRNA (cytosine(1402)-N(4))-methyltransferase [Parcubacteria group bacterium]